MNMSRDELCALLGALGATRDEELDCDLFLEQLPSYLEAMKSGASTPECREMFEHHLDICPGCREEFEVLAEAFDAGTI